MRRYIVLAGVALCLHNPVLAQNTQNTNNSQGSNEATNVARPSVVPPKTGAAPTPKKAPDAPIDRGNPTATRKSQYLGNPKNSLLGR
jgi:hypothetical protein